MRAFLHCCRVCVSVIDVVIHGFSLVSMVLSVDSTGHDGKPRYKRNLGKKKRKNKRIKSQKL